MAYLTNIWIKPLRRAFSVCVCTGMLKFSFLQIMVSLYKLLNLFWESYVFQITETSKLWFKVWGWLLYVFLVIALLHVFAKVQFVKDLSSCWKDVRHHNRAQYTYWSIPSKKFSFWNSQLSDQKNQTIEINLEDESWMPRISSNPRILEQDKYEILYILVNVTCWIINHHLI